MRSENRHRLLDQNQQARPLARLVLWLVSAAGSVALVVMVVDSLQVGS